MDIRTFELGLRIKWQLPNSFSVGDYHVTFYATSTVRDLLDELLALKKWSGDYCLTRTVANIRFEDVSRTERISLPQNGLIVDQNIIDGTELVVERTAGNSPIVHNPTLAPEEDDPLCLVDETGTRRGRVSLLPKGRKITATTRPEASDCIVVDDARLINGTLMFEASDDDVEVSWEGDGFTLYLSGEQQVTKGRRIHVGTMVAVTPPNSPEDVRLSWLLTTASRAAQRTTQGRVRVEPRSRTSFPTYKSLPAALASLPGRPTASPPTPFPIDQVVLPVIMALALAAATQSLYMLVAAPIAVAGTVWSWRRNNRFREEADAKALVSWQSQIWSSLDALQNMAQSEHVSLGQEAPDSGYWTRAGYRRLSLKTLAALSASTRFRSQLPTARLLDVLYEPDDLVLECVDYLVTAGLVARRPGSQIELVHDFLAEYFHNRSGYELRPTDRDNVGFHLEAGDRSPGPVVYPRAIRNRKTGRFGWSIFWILFVLMFARLLGLGIPWTRVGSLQPIYTNSAKIFDGAYVPIFIAHGAWAIYITMFYVRVFSMLRETGWQRLMSRGVQVVMALSVVVAVFIPYAWMFSIGCGGLFLGFKLLALYANDDLGMGARTRIGEFGRTTVAALLVLTALGGGGMYLSFALESQPGFQSGWVTLSIIWGIVMTIPCLALAPYHISRPAAAELLGLMARPSREKGTV